MITAEDTLLYIDDVGERNWGAMGWRRLPKEIREGERAKYFVQLVATHPNPDPDWMRAVVAALAERMQR